MSSQLSNPAGLGDFSAIRDDLINLLAITMGKEKATTKVADLEAMIRGEAKTGAEAAIPTIRAQVKQEATAALTPVKPWIIAALIVSSVALVATVGTVLYVRRKTK